MNKLEAAAMKYCAANTRLRELRVLWVELKSKHAEAECNVCFKYPGPPEDEWCDLCKVYPLAEYRAALRARHSASRSMTTWYGHILKRQSKVTA